MGQLSLVGTLPVSAINIGLQASLGGFAAKLTKLQADFSTVAVGAKGSADVALDFPPSPALATAYIASLSPLELAAQFNPATIVTVSGDVNLSAGLELGLVELQLAAVGKITAQLRAGLQAPGIAGWSYLGRSQGFGGQLQRGTQAGFGNVGPKQQIQGLVIATESPASWGAFSLGFNTGSTSREVATFGVERLTYLGSMGADRWNTGTLKAFVPIDLFELQLKGAKASLEGDLKFCAGVNPPSVQAAIDAAVGLDFTVLVKNFVDVSVDFALEAKGFQLAIDGVLSLQADLRAQLSAGGLSVWAYTGTAGEFGATLAETLKRGLPGGNGPDAPSYGLALACALPSAWAAFGLVLATG